MKLNKKQIEALGKYEDMLVRMYKGTFRGAVLSKKQRELGEIYDSVADGRCSSCNNNWIYRLANWYISSLPATKRKKIV